MDGSFTFTMFGFILREFLTLPEGLTGLTVLKSTLSYMFYEGMPKPTVFMQCICSPFTWGK